jgi:indole-3-glycerol phosphate synthase
MILLYSDIIVFMKNYQIIAEVKTKSPFGYRSEKSWDELFQIAESVGHMISIHTDIRWGGDFDLIRKAKSLTDKSILAKGIHATDIEVQAAIDAGADYVLVVGRIPKVHQDKCLLEPDSLADLRLIPDMFKVVWNSRDLNTGGLKSETFEQAREVFGGWLCQASNIKSVSDIKSGADAILVGTNLEEFIHSI